MSIPLLLPPYLSQLIVSATDCIVLTFNTNADTVESIADPAVNTELASIGDLQHQVLIDRPIHVIDDCSDLEVVCNDSALL
eukprot:4821339-Amphidinium_carterae.1